jgi:low temperature requirement protein LtrA
MVFFAIWWAWMNFTWFASAYDCDDVPYRLATFGVLTGALILAAGVPEAFEHGDFLVVTVGYVVMRIMIVMQWLRAAASDPPRRTAAHRYALGIGLAQLGWIGLLYVPAGFAVPGFAALVVCELLVPVWSEAAGPTTWHAHHIAERYGLLTIIVLGESVLAATSGIQAALAAGESAPSLAPLIIAGLVILFCMWWLYFERPVHDRLGTFGPAFVWGYGHYVVFASCAAVGAGLAVATEHATGHGALTDRGAALAVAIPVAVYVMALWALHHRPDEGALPHLGPVAALLILAAPVGPQPYLLVGLVMVVLLALRLVAGQREASHA